MQIQGPVLVATDLDDGADEALRQADLLARAAGAALRVCHVMPELLSLDPLFPHLNLREALAAAEVQADAAQAVEDRVSAVIGRTPEDYETLLLVGSAHAALVAAAEGARAGLLVLAATGRHGRAGLGGVAERVVRHAPCPVLVVRPATPGKVLGATDFSDPALPAIEAAVGEARRRGVPLAAIHCMEVLPPVVIGYEVPALTAEVVAAMRDQWQQRLAEAVGRFGAQPDQVQLFVESGPAGALIVNRATALPAELVVVGTHGRSGVRRLVLGSVAETVVRTAPCSVLVVRLH
jgi:nucleotide-binding universal stress UspA family protein